MALLLFYLIFPLQTLILYSYTDPQTHENICEVTMADLFDYNNKVISALTKIADSVMLGILWIICSIPVITLGASSSAFYYAYNKSIRQESGYALKLFFQGFKANFKQATLCWLVLIVLAVFGFFDCFVLITIGGSSPVSSILLAIMILILVTLSLLALVLFPYIARYENTWKDSLKNSLLILLSNFLWAVLLFLILFAAVFLSMCIPMLCIFMPAVYMFFANKILEHILKKYMRPEDLKAQQELEKGNA